MARLCSLLPRLLLGGNEWVGGWIGGREGEREKVDGKRSEAGGRGDGNEGRIIHLEAWIRINSTGSGGFWFRNM